MIAYLLKPLFFGLLAFSCTQFVKGLYMYFTGGLYALAESLNIATVHGACLAGICAITFSHYKNLTQFLLCVLSGTFFLSSYGMVVPAAFIVVILVARFTLTPISNLIFYEAEEEATSHESMAPENA